LYEALLEALNESYARAVIRGAFAAALTPLMDGGTRLDEDALLLRRLARGRRCRRDPGDGDDGGGDPAVAGGTPSVVELHVDAAAGGCRSPCTAARRRRPRPPPWPHGEPRPGADAVAVIAPPYFPLDAAALEAHFAGGRRVRAASLLRVRVRGPERLPGTRLGHRAAAREHAEPAWAEGVGQALGGRRAVPPRRPGHLRRCGVAGRPRARERRCGRRLRPRVGLPGGCGGARPRAVRGALPRGGPAPGGTRPLPVPGRGEGRRRQARRRDPAGCSRAATHADPCRARGSRPAVSWSPAPGRWGRGSRTAWRSVAPTSSSLRSWDDRIRSTSRAMGGVRQQFSTAAEVRLAQRASRSSPSARAAVLPPGRVPVPRDDREGLAELDERREVQAGLRVRSSGSARRSSPVSRRATCSAPVFCAQDGVADPPAVAQGLVRRAVELGARLREHPGGEHSRRGRFGRHRVRAVVVGPREAGGGGASDPAALPPAPRDRGPALAARDAAHGGGDRDRLPLPPPG
jgi:hypothetical protein